VSYCPSLFVLVFLLGVFHTHGSDASTLPTLPHWILVDNFEQASPLLNWIKMDTDNNTQPFIHDPQVTEVRLEAQSNNHYLIKKPAAEGIVGNRKAMSISKLPTEVAVGDTYTFYTRIKVEYFPNNHSFGLSNLSAQEIAKQNYNAFEPMLRVTDKLESNGVKNNGTLMVMGDNKRYHKIRQLKTGQAAQPMIENKWYELWYVINNARLENGGQSYDLYMRGSEFRQQQKVFEDAKFRMKREQPLGYFMTISNTGSSKKPYGNGGLMYDDIYMAKGLALSSPLTSFE
tara:strand:- start:44739 stop:45599 length:861 start_codon:yes stop_codon:yes gene_type:complete